MGKLKALVVIDSIHVGGIGASLTSYLEELKAFADCDLLMFNGLDKAPFREIPTGVNILKAPSVLKVLTKTEKELKEESFFLYLVSFIVKVIIKLFGARAAHRFLFRFCKTLKGYDLAISYRHDEVKKSIYPGCNDFVLQKVKAGQKLTYFHTDIAFSGYFDSVIGNGFDYIVCVSSGCRDSLVQKFPEFESKCVVCENFIKKDSIDALVKEPFRFDNRYFNLFTSCRFSEEKAIPRALDAIEMLSGHKYPKDFRWYIAGDGPEREKAERKISGSAFLKEHVRLIGLTNNPLQYMASADAFLLPSRYEASPVVYSECKYLSLPILTTQNCSTREMITERNAGCVCENSCEGIYNLLNAVLSGTLSLEPYKDKAVSETVNAYPGEQLKALMADISEKLK